LQALIEYANAMQPLIVQAGATLQRDAVILQEAEDGNDAVLCDGRLEADNSAMKGVLEQVRAVEPTADGAAIHDLVVRSGDAWTEALDNVERFCSTGNALYKVRGAQVLGDSAAARMRKSLRALMMADGVELGGVSSASSAHVQILFTHSVRTIRLRVSGWPRPSRTSGHAVDEQHTAVVDLGGTSSAGARSPNGPRCRLAPNLAGTRPTGPGEYRWHQGVRQMAGILDGGDLGGNHGHD
jgi:hypothetical protein